MPKPNAGPSIAVLTDLSQLDHPFRHPVSAPGAAIELAQSRRSTVERGLAPPAAQAEREPALGLHGMRQANEAQDRKSLE
jgi:hypothetical protein